MDFFFYFETFKEIFLIDFFFVWVQPASGSNTTSIKYYWNNHLSFAVIIIIVRIQETQFITEERFFSSEFSKKQKINGIWI